MGHFIKNMRMFLVGLSNLLDILKAQDWHFFHWTYHETEFFGIGVHCAQFSGHFSDWMVVNSLRRMWQMPWLHGYCHIHQLGWWQGEPLDLQSGCYHWVDFTCWCKRRMRRMRFHVSLLAKQRWRVVIPGPTRDTFVVALLLGSAVFQWICNLLLK